VNEDSWPRHKRFRGAYLGEFISGEAWQVGAAQPDKERWHFIRERVSPDLR
jgi:hypothetical protein